MGLKEQIDTSLSNTAFYQKFFTDEKKQQLCPFHEEKEPSFSVDWEKGVWFCHAGCGGGDKYAFWMKKHEVDFKTALKEIAAAWNLQPDFEKKRRIEQSDIMSDVLKWHKRLEDRPDIQELLQERGISRKIQIEYRLGWNHTQKRLWIPMIDKGEVYALRQYDLTHIHGKNKFTARKGYNETVLWPLEITRTDSPIWLLGGEPDTLTALSLGFNAVCFTNGEGKVSAKHLPYLKGKTVYICFDIDKAGKTGAVKVARELIDIARETFIIDIPPDGLPENGDFTDYAKLVDFDRTKIDELRKGVNQWLH